MPTTTKSTATLVPTLTPLQTWCLCQLRLRHLRHHRVTNAHCDCANRNSGADAFAT